MAAAVTVLSAWTDLPGYLRATQRIFRTGEGVLRFSVDHRGEQVLVGLRCQRFVTGSQWLGITAAVCPLARLRLRGALLANLELPLGALAVLRDQVALRQTLPLHALRSDLFEHTLRALVATAAELKASAAAAERGDEAPYAYAFR